MDSPTVELMSALSSLFESGKFSDMIIVSANNSYPVHRALFASRSSFFEAACSNPFRESETGIIELSEDDPEAVKHMINYIYHLDYLSKPWSRGSSQRSSVYSTYSPVRKLSSISAEDPLLAMLSAAAPPATSHGQRCDHPAVAAPLAKHPDTPMQDQFMDDPFDYVPMEANADDERPHLVTHARVYALAEKYDIVGLKALASKKFASSIEAHLSSDELPDACQEAYESTVDTDRGLRDIVVQTFRNYPNLSLRKDVEMMLRCTPDLAFELYRMASGLPVSS